jgi:hypothetical protein
MMSRIFLIVAFLALAGFCWAQKKPADTVRPAPVVAKPVVAKPAVALGGQPNGQVVERAGRGFDYWVFLPVVLVIGFGVVVWRRMDAMKVELRSRKRELRSFTENYGKSEGVKTVGMDRREVEKILVDSKVLMELKQAVGRLQQQVAQLEGRKGKLVEQVKVVEPMRGKPVIAAALSAASEASSAPAASDVFYMAGPVNNYFPNSAKSLTKDNTVYRFKLSANQQEAEYELHTQGAPVMEIVQLAESYIKAACDEENLPGNPVKNILTKRSGQAILEGDKWVIKRKALIRYE